VKCNPIGPETARQLGNFDYSEDRRIRQKAQLVRTRLPYAKVLVVDDVITNLDVARGMLKPYGMTVDCVTSGQKAIDLIRAAEVKYNAVFMDHMMPEMDGIEAVRIIRSEIGTEYARTIPIIALTANAIIGNEELFLNNGFQAFLSKPIDIMRLNEVINRWVRDKDTEKELRLIHGQEWNAPNQSIEDGELSRVKLLKGRSIAGINVEKAIIRFGGEEGYLETLRSYVAHTPALLDQLKAPIRETLENYAIIVHGVKGSSYGICADALGKLAEELEMAAKAEDLGFVESHTESFITRTEALLKNLTELLQSLDEENQKPLKTAPALEVLARIREAAGSYDIGKLDAAMEELDRYSYETRQDLIPWLKEQINQSDFDIIQKRLEELK
jgi:CheY-like chemotaxis protein